MSHNIVRLISSIVNQPQLVTPEYSEFAIKFLIDRNNNPEMAIAGVKATSKNHLAFDATTKVGLIPIIGPLTYTPIYGMCGEESLSYQRIQSDFDSLVQMGAKKIILDLDTPGGMAYGAFETASYLREQADRHGVRLIAYVDGTAASAGYALASVCHEIISNPYAGVGSVGVVVSLANVSKAEKRVGIERTYIYAGKSKIPFNAEGDFTEEFLNDVQEKVDTLYASFIDHVATYRALSQEVVKGTEAKVFNADKALAIKLIDSVMTRQEFQSYLFGENPSGNEMSLRDRLFGKKSDETLEAVEAPVETVDSSVSAANDEAVSQLNTKIEELTANVKELAAKLEEALQENEKLETIVAGYKQAEADAAQKAAEAKANARKETLIAILGDEKGTKTYEALSHLNDETFEMMVENFKTKLEGENNSVMFQEQGVGGATAKVEEDATARILKQKYKSN